MSLVHLSVFIGLALLISPFLQKQSREWFLLVGSIFAVYWLQPPSAIRNLDFWLPTATIALTIIVYTSLKSGSDNGERRKDVISGLIIALTVLLIGSLRYLEPLCCLTATRPPQIIYILISIILMGLVRIFINRIFLGKKRLLNLLLLFVLGVFLVLKNETLTLALSAWLRGTMGQSVELAQAQDISWLGFSYVAFRLLHTLRDRITGRLPDVSLREFVTYIIFFPAFTAGPIDRIQRFVGDLRQEARINSPQIVMGAKRIFIGVFKKFALADSLALIALSPQNAFQTTSALWTWVALYAYSFRIYLDFSGYTDIAIGIGHLFGFNLPENFNRSYLQSNLTTFWNNWHITLTQWFRAYFFNPLTRALRTAGRKFPMWLIILTGQLSTMVLIGLWHGISLNFIIWGAWHGLGLFLHNRWTNFSRPLFSLENRPQYLQKIVTMVGVFVTFNYVAIGWLWFALPLPEQSWHVLSMIFGIR